MRQLVIEPPARSIDFEQTDVTTIQECRCELLSVLAPGQSAYFVGVSIGEVTSVSLASDASLIRTHREDRHILFVFGT